MTYNGWTNYETWLVNLWFDNWDFIDMVDNGFFDDMDEDEVRDAIAEYISNAVFDYIDDMTNGAMDSGGSFGFIGDVLTGFTGEVDWQEIADHYVDDVMEALNNNG